MQWQALAEKYGQTIVIWSQGKNDAEESYWGRFVLSSKFSNGVACSARNTQPLVVILEANHYQWLKPVGSHTIPLQWLQETPSIAFDQLRGAGKRECLSDTGASTPSVCSHKLDHVAVPPQKEPRCKRPRGNASSPSLFLPRSDARAGLTQQSEIAPSSRTPSVFTHRPAPDADLCANSDSAPSCVKEFLSVDALPKQKAPRNTTDRLVPKFRAIACMQAKDEGTGLHVHPGSIGPRGGFPFVCVKCKERVSYPTVSCCPKNVFAKRRDVSKQARKQAWKAILKKANQLAAVAKAKHVKAVRAQKAEARLQQRQHLQQLAVQAASSKPDPLKGLQVFPKTPLNIWWKCPWCDFSIQSCVQRTSRWRFKKQHLERVHNQPNIKLPTGDLLQNPTRFVNAKATFKRRWEIFHRVFQQLKWKGAHVIPLERVYCRVYTNAKGMPIEVPIHQCIACNRHVSRNSLATSVCPNIVGKAASVASRKKVWRICRKRTSLEEKKGDAKRQKLQGLQGIRIGEARKPGPCSFKTWSQNIHSWHAHGANLLNKAQEAQVQLAFVQEHNLTATSIPAVSHSCKRAQWQSLFIPKPSNSNGGVAILCHESFALTEVQRIHRDSGQLLHAVLHGGQRDIHVLSIYRHHTDEHFQIFREAELIIGSFGSQDWIVALDANADMSQGFAHDFFVGVGGVQCAVARHTRSVRPIDAIWASGGLQPMSHAELPGDGDHSIAQCSFAFEFQKCNRPLWRFSRTRKVVADPPMISTSWLSHASAEPEWLLALGSVEAAWTLWCLDVETWLVQAGLLENKWPEQRIGDAPTVRPGSHRVGANQTFDERILQRFIRRLQEAQTIAWRGSAVPLTLLKKLQNAACPLDEQQAVRARAWGLAIQLATSRLRNLQQRQRCEALQHWRRQMHDVSHACKWIRKEEAAPNAFKDFDSTVLTSKALIVEKLTAHWTRVFGTQGSAADVNNFMLAFEQDFPDPVPMPELPCITGEETLRAAKHMKKKASGLDGVSPSWLALLPPEAHDRLAQMLMTFEAKGSWPAAVNHWRIVTLPKQRKGTLPSLDEIRPIAVGSAIYRLWGHIRLRHLAPTLTQYLESNQAGGIGGEDVTSLLLSLDLDMDSAAYPCLMALDFAKAFDSTDFALCLAVFERLRIPAPVLNLLKAQWGRQRRWLTFAGACAQHPVVNCLALPQGDPFSPIAMSLVLMLAKRRQERLVPQSRAILYLDDRTLLAPDPATLNAALRTWDLLHQNSRLKTNPCKTQVLGRTWSGYVQLQAADMSPATSAEVLGVTVGLVPRAQSNAEQKRSQQCETFAQRISVLPVTQKFRATLATLTLAPKRAWGPVLSGRVPTQAELKNHADDFRLAVKGRFLEGTASRPLEKVLLLGHASDLLFYSCLRLLSALTKWRCRHPGLWSQKPSSFIAAMSDALSNVGLQAEEWGCWKWSSGQWNTNSPPDSVPRLAHEFRQHWRALQLRTWLASDRNDARLARQNHVTITDALVQKLHVASAGMSAHEIGIMCGGLKTDAKASPPPMYCFECQQCVCPHTYHVLWECSHWAELRRLPASRCPLTNRLGWGPAGVDEARLKQCAQIRESLCKAQAKRSYSRPEPPGGDPLGQLVRNPEQGLGDLFSA